jgi:cell wall-associated NlpC family hydrolase
MLIMVSFATLLLAACSPGRKSTTAPAKVSTATSMATDTMLTRLLGAPVPRGTNPQFVQTIAPWMGVPYKLGGQTKAGTDCSGLIGAVHQQLNGWRLPRTTAELFKQHTAMPVDSLQSGDLVFFKINTPQPGHAGLYLWQGYFLHASTSKGVIISHLSEPYWSKYFESAGKIIQPKSFEKGPKGKR